MRRGSNHIVLDNMRDDFPDLVAWSKGEGQPVRPDGHLTYEIRDVSIELEDPFDALPLGTLDRNVDLAKPAVKALQLMAGFSDPMLQHRVFGSYEHSLGEEIRYGFGLDSATRILQTNGQTCDALIRVQDRKSNVLALWFVWREGKLELHVSCREDEAFVACQENIFAFTQLQISVARYLNTDVGHYHHHVNAWHIDASNLGLFDHMHKTTELVRPSDFPVGIGDASYETWDEVANRAHFVLDVGSGRLSEGVNANAFTPSEKWYLDKLRPHWRPGG